MIDDRVEHRAGSTPQELRFPLQRLAHSSEVRRRVVTDVENGVWCHEHLDLAELDLLGVVQVLRRLQHEEQGIAVLFQLRTLMSVQGVLDDEIVEVDVHSDLLELGLGRLEEPCPTERVIATRRAPIGRVEPTGSAHTVDVEGAVNDHTANRCTSAGGGQPNASPSRSVDGLMSGSRIMRNELRNPRSEARIGTSIATWRAASPASELMRMISSWISAG